MRTACVAALLAATCWLAAAARAQPARPVTRTTLPDDWIELRTALGVELERRWGRSDVDPALGFEAHYGITDRWQWSIPGGLAYRGGEHGALEWVVRGGVTSFGLGYSNVEDLILSGTLGAGADVRWWVGDDESSLVAGADVVSGFRWSSGEPFLGEDDYGPRTWRWRASLGFTDTVGDYATLAVGIHYSERFLVEGALPGSRAERVPHLVIGSLPVAFRALPLLQLHLSDHVSIDLYAVGSYDIELPAWRTEVLFGATFLW